MKKKVFTCTDPLHSKTEKNERAVPDRAIFRFMNTEALQYGYSHRRLTVLIIDARRIFDDAADAAEPTIHCGDGPFVHDVHCQGNCFLDRMVLSFIFVETFNSVRHIIARTRPRIIQDLENGPKTLKHPLHMRTGGARTTPPIPRCLLFKGAITKTPRLHVASTPTRFKQLATVA
jgi:hypothetical protein